MSRPALPQLPQLPNAPLPSFRRWFMREVAKGSLVLADEPTARLAFNAGHRAHAEETAAAVDALVTYYSEAHAVRQLGTEAA